MDAPENVCGLPVRDENFVGRTGDVERAWRRLETDHAVLAAPAESYIQRVCAAGES